MLWLTNIGGGILSRTSQSLLQLAPSGCPWINFHQNQTKKETKNRFVYRTKEKFVYNSFR
jgi:hypothetical protein